MNWDIIVVAVGLGLFLLNSYGGKVWDWWNNKKDTKEKDTLLDSVSLWKKLVELNSENAEAKKTLNALWPLLNKDRDNG